MFKELFTLNEAKETVMFFDYKADAQAVKKELDSKGIKNKIAYANGAIRLRFDKSPETDKLIPGFTEKYGASVK